MFVLAKVLDVSANGLQGNLYSLASAIGLYELDVNDNVTISICWRLLSPQWR